MSNLRNMLASVTEKKYVLRDRKLIGIVKNPLKFEKKLCRAAKKKTLKNKMEISMTA